MSGNAGADFLMRMIMLLLSLADAAERAAGRSLFTRRRMLAALRPAERAAFWSVADAARHYGAPVPAAAHVAYGDWMAAADGDHRHDALNLAGRLRALALALTVIAAWADYFGRRLTAVRHTPWRSRQWSSARPSGHAQSGEKFCPAMRTRAPP